MANTRLTISEHIVWKDVDGIVYILNPEAEEVHVVNETGSIIWRLLARGRTRDRILAEIIRRYHVDDRKAALDIREFIDIYTKKKFFFSKSIKSVKKK